MFEIIESSIKHPKYQEIDPYLKTISLEAFGKRLIFKADGIKRQGRAKLIGGEIKKYSAYLSLLSELRDHKDVKIRADIFYLDTIDSWLIDKRILGELETILKISKS